MLPKDPLDFTSIWNCTSKDCDYKLTSEQVDSLEDQVKQSCKQIQTATSHRTIVLGRESHCWCAILRFGRILRKFGNSTEPQLSSTSLSCHESKVKSHIPIWKCSRVFLPANVHRVGKCTVHGFKFTTSKELLTCQAALGVFLIQVEERAPPEKVNFRLGF